MEVLRAAGWWAVPDGAPNQYREHFRCADLSVGTYCIPMDGKDGQDPHTEDEVYVVLRGHAQLVGESGEVAVAPGSVVFVPAGEALTVLVVFAPAERSRS